MKTVKTNTGIRLWNHILYKASLVALTVALFTCLTGCSGDGADDPQPQPGDDLPTLAELQAEVVEKISNITWSASSITRESVNVADDFANFSLSFGNGTYSSQNGAHVWASSGTWTWVSGKSDQILRDDNVVIDLKVETNKLTLSFELQEDVFSTGKSKTVTSSFVFVLVK